MTLLGKIFIVLIFIMSLVFMSFAVAVYATHRNWKDLVTNPTPTEKMPLGLRPQLDEARKLNNQLRNEIEKSKNALALERAARREAVAVLEARSQQLQEQLVQKQNEYTELLAQQRNAISTVDSAQSELKRLSGDVAQLREQVRTTQLDRDKQFQRVVALTDEVHQLRGDQARLATRRDQLVAQVQMMDTVLKAHDLDINTPVTEIPPRLDGVITGVSQDKFIEVSLGSDDGLRIGHQLIVFREGKFLGRAVVRKISSDRAVAELLAEFREGPVQRGDRVATKVS